MKGNSFVIAAVAIGVLAFGMVRIVKSQVPKPVSGPPFAGVFPVEVRPLTLYSREMVWKSGDAPTLRTEHTEAYRSDGSYSNVESRFRRATGELLEKHRGILLSSGVRMETSDHVKAVTTIANSQFFDRHIGMSFDPRTGCSQRFDPGQPGRTAISSATQELLGYRVLAFATKSHNANFTVWAAPDLNCLELRRLAEFKKTDGSLSDSSELTVDRVELGTPDSSLFQVPAGFTEVSPSDRYRLEVQIRNVAVDDRVIANLKRLDNSYFKNRPTSQQ